MFMCLILGVAACGQKSVVKTDVPPQTLASTFGDGKLVRWRFPVLITTDPSETPVEAGFLFGGIARMFANLGVALGAGKTEMYFHQPTPEIPEMFQDVRLKRVFFYIEPEKNASRRANWFSRFFKGKGDVDFNFIDKLILRVRPEVADMKKVCLIEDQGKFAPLFPCKDPSLNSEKTDRYMSYFKVPTPEEEPDLSELDEFVIVKYDGEKKKKHVMNQERGAMYMFRTERPGVTYHFLENNPIYSKLIVNKVTLDNVILVELKKDPSNVTREIFENQLSEDADYIDRTLGVEEIEECNDSICLDVKVEPANLLPFLKRLNSNRIDAFVEASKIPETFQLKGFVEFEVGLNTGF